MTSTLSPSKMPSSTGTEVTFPASSTAFTEYDPSAAASSALTGTDSTLLCSTLVNETVTGAPSSVPASEDLSRVIETVMVADSVLSPVWDWALVFSAMATVPAEEMCPDVDFPPGRSIRTRAPFLAISCDATGSFTVTCRVVPDAVSTVPPAGPLGTAVRLVTRIGPGSITTSAGDTVPVWETPVRPATS